MAKRGLDLTDGESSSDEPLAKLRKKEERSTKRRRKNLTDYIKGGATIDFEERNPGKNFWVISPAEVKSSSKIAAFDMDHTLICPKNGKKFPKKGDRTDWIWWPNGESTVKKKLKEIHQKGYRIVVFTNQMGIEKGRQKSKAIIGKIKDVSNNAQVPMTGFVCGGKNKYRKPFTTSWEYFKNECNKDADVDLKQSFYVGDAAGRAKGWKKGAKKDFDCSDRKFADNLGMKFHTPEEFFLGEEKAEFEWGKVARPSTYLENIPPAPPTLKPKKEKEVIVMCGFPGAGKSSICKSILKDYVWVNQDTIKGPVQKCIKACESAMKKGDNVVIDNTNRNTKTRGNYIKLAKKYGYSARCWWLTNGDDEKDFKLAKHLNSYRTRMTNLRPVPGVGLHGFRKEIVKDPPTTKEGFDEVLKVPFIPRFKTPDDRRIFCEWCPNFR